MLRYLPVRRVHARQVLDSRGNPTVEGQLSLQELQPVNLKQWNYGMEKKTAMWA